MSKKLKRVRAGLLASALLAFSAVQADCVEYCQPEFCQPCNRGNFYIGVGLDNTGTYSKERDLTEVFYPSDPIFPDPSSVFDANYNASGDIQFFGDIIAGYVTPSWCGFNVALEGYISAGPKMQSEAYFERRVSNVFGYDFDYLNISTKDFYLNTVYGICVMPGYHIWDDVTFYGRVGYTAARAQLKLKSSLTGTPDIGFETPAMLTYEVNNHKTLHGLQAGLGFNLRVSNHFSLGMGYSWSRYNSISAHVETSDDEVFGEFFEQTQVRNVTVKPRTEGFTTSILYTFCPSDTYCQAPINCNQEIYVGGEGVRDNSFIRFHQHRANSQPPSDERGGVSKQSQIDHDTARGWGYEVFAGYGYTFDCGAYAGVEGFYNGTESKFSFKEIDLASTGVSSEIGVTVNHNFFFNLKESYGFSILPGYKLNDHLLIYAKLGWTQRRFHFKETYTGDPTPQARDLAVSNNNTTKNIYGYIFGLGFDLQLCNNLYLRNEYAVTAYSNLKQKRFTSPLLSAAGFFVAYDDVLKNTTGQYKLGLVYKFPVCRR